MLKKLTLIILLIILLWIVYHNLTKEKMVDNGVRGNGVEQVDIFLNKQ